MRSPSIPQAPPGTAPSGVGGHHEAAGIERALFALGPFLELLRRRRGGRNAHERCARNAHAGKLGRGGEAVADFPLHHEWRGHHVAEKAQPRHDGAERGRLRKDVDEFDFQHVARLGAFDEDRPGQRMDAAGIERGQIRDRGDLAVDAVARLQHNVLAFADFKKRRDVGMIAVVAGVRLSGERLAAVDTDGMHVMSPQGEPARKPTLPCDCVSTADANIVRHRRT